MCTAAGLQGTACVGCGVVIFTGSRALQQLLRCCRQLHSHCTAAQSSQTFEGVSTQISNMFATFGQDVFKLYLKQ